LTKNRMWVRGDRPESIFGASCWVVGWVWGGALSASSPICKGFPINLHERSALHILS
jgi:hypothetical protein